MNRPEDRDERPGSQASEDRFEAMLEARFREADRDAMAREIASHDRSQPPPGFDEAHVRRRLHFHGDVPAKVRAMLQNWVPALLAHAAQRGVRLRDQNHELHVYLPEAYAQATGRPLPAGMRLPATSFEYQSVSRVYQVQLVIPAQIGSRDALVSVFRALIARLLGDIYLHEEVFSRAPYQDQPAGAAAEVTISLPDQLRLLAEAKVTTPVLLEALDVHARVVGLNPRRSAAQVRKSYFQTLGAQLHQGGLSPSEQAMVAEAVTHYLDGLRADLPRRIADMVAEVEALNGQMNVLPVDELPDYQKLRSANPRHYLRSAKLRLVFLQETLAALLEDYDELTGDPPRITPLLEQRVDSQLAELRAQGLVRPYLLDNVQLSDELQQQLAAFPLEVHALMQRLPPAPSPDKLFKSLSKRISNSIYQRLYTALILFQAWFRARDLGREERFTQGAQVERLKSLMANFRFRLPILAALTLRLGVVLDMADAAGADDAAGSAASQRIPREGLRRAWGQYLPHTLVHSFFAAGQRLPGFDPQNYMARVEQALRTQVTQGPGPAHLAFLLQQLEQQASGDGLALLTEQLRQPSGTWRFAVSQALAPPPEKLAGDGEARQAQLSGWARLVLEAWEHSRENAIGPQGDPA
jgi:hypothetical protein